MQVGRDLIRILGYPSGSSENMRLGSPRKAGSRRVYLSALLAKEQLGFVMSTNPPNQVDIGK